MGKHVQIRDLPLGTHQKLKIRAAMEGLSMSDYLKRLIDRDLKRPRWDEIKARMAEMGSLDLSVSSVDLIRHERDSR